MSISCRIAGKPLVIDGAFLEDGGHLRGTFRCAVGDRRCVGRRNRWRCFAASSPIFPEPIIMTDWPFLGRAEDRAREFAGRVALTETAICPMPVFGADPFGNAEGAGENLFKQSADGAFRDTEGTRRRS